MCAAGAVEPAHWVFGDCPAELVEEPVKATLASMFTYLFTSEFEMAVANLMILRN